MRRRSSRRNLPMSAGGTLSLRRRSVRRARHPARGARRRVQQVLLNLTLRLREMYVERSLREEQAALTLAEVAGPLRTSAAAILELERGESNAPKEALETVVRELGREDLAALLPHLSEAREQRALPGGTAARSSSGHRARPRSLRPFEAAMNPFDLRGPQFLVFYAALTLLTLLVIWWLRRSREMRCSRSAEPEAGTSFSRTHPDSHSRHSLTRTSSPTSAAARRRRSVPRRFARRSRPAHARRREGSDVIDRLQDRGAQDDRACIARTLLGELRSEASLQG